MTYFLPHKKPAYPVASIWEQYCQTRSLPPYLCNYSLIPVHRRNGATGLVTGWWLHSYTTIYLRAKHQAENARTPNSSASLDKSASYTDLTNNIWRPTLYHWKPRSITWQYRQGTEGWERITFLTSNLVHGTAAVGGYNCWSTINVSYSIISTWFKFVVLDLVPVSICCGKPVC